MTITTPSKNGPIEKEIRVGLGVRFRLEGSRFSTSGEVIEVNEESGAIMVEGTGFGKQVISKDRVFDVLENIVLDQAQNKHNIRDKKYKYLSDRPDITAVQETSVNMSG